MTIHTDLIQAMAKAIGDTQTEEGWGVLSEQITAWEMFQAAQAAYMAQLATLKPSAWLHIKPERNIVRVDIMPVRERDEISKPLFQLAPLD